METQSVLHRAETRGHADHGWLNTYHTFSFANYYDPERVHFGALRVLNDDTIEGGSGFGMHPHDNMEIITIPLEGALEHKDSMGNTGVIRKGEIQVMSAGTGIFHSEYNKLQDQDCKLLQIWIFPNKKNVVPRYDQITLRFQDKVNTLQQIVSPDAGDEGTWIHQNAWFHMAKYSEGFTDHYALKNPDNGVYFFVIQGSVSVGNQALHERDGFGVWNTDTINILANTDAEILMMEVPMKW
jgi:redox-sensitive bicupin YhaK (pirin superfamily)